MNKGNLYIISAPSGAGKTSLVKVLVESLDNITKRIFVTISYLSENFTDDNKKVKAYFVPRPTDPIDLEKDKLRLLRSDPDKYKHVYNLM